MGGKKCLNVQLFDEIDVGEQHTAAAVPSETQSVQGITED
jgi:hypothetical protein